MILAPRMIQAMEILQLPLMALQERIDQELIANPVLELRSPGDGPEPSSEEADEAVSSASSTAEPERELVVRQDGSAEDFERAANMVERYEGYLDESAAWQRPRANYDDVDPKAEAMQNTPDSGVTLQEFMLNEWHLEEVAPRVAALGEAMIRNLDDNGYLHVPLEDLAAEVDPPATAAELQEALVRVQQVGPAGVGARNIEECLLLQLAADPAFGGAGVLPEDALEVRLVRHHLRDIEANRYPQMARSLGTTIEQVKQSVDRIRRLNPKPGAAISPRRTPPIIPDVRIAWDDEAGQYRVLIDGADLPELYISRTYRQMVKQRDLDDKTRRFVANNIRSARWLMEAIEQRRDTLRRVTESIVRFQRPFFDDGPEHMQPLKMQQVADDVRLHVGTISRAVSDKYADTPWGIFPLRDFFTGGTATAGGEDVSYDRIRVRLKAIIDAEDKADPLSDETIQKMLLAEGIEKFSRRTVAKYREEMGIPSSHRRRQY